MAQLPALALSEGSLRVMVLDVMADALAMGSGFVMASTQSHGNESPHAWHLACAWLCAPVGTSKPQCWCHSHFHLPEEGRCVGYMQIVRPGAARRQSRMSGMGPSPCHTRHHNPTLCFGADTQQGLCLSAAMTLPAQGHEEREAGAGEKSPRGVGAGAAPTWLP